MKRKKKCCPSSKPNCRNAFEYSLIVIEYGIDSDEAKAYREQQIKVDPSFEKRAQVIEKLWRIK